MTTVRITNGFGDIGKGVDGIVLTGELLSSEMNEEDFLIIDGDNNVLIKRFFGRIFSHFSEEKAKCNVTFTKDFIVFIL